MTDQITTPAQVRAMPIPRIPRQRPAQEPRSFPAPLRFAKFVVGNQRRERLRVVRGQIIHRLIRHPDRLPARTVTGRAYARRQNA